MYGSDLQQLRQDLTSQIRQAREPLIVLEMESSESVGGAAADAFVALLRLANEIMEIDRVADVDEVYLAEDFSERLTAASQLMDDMRRKARESLA